MDSIKIIECPRDAMQGIEEWIPTEKKEKYIKKLLSVGFDTIDFGSFVSPKAIPQMRDTPEIIQSISREEKGFYQASCNCCKSARRFRCLTISSHRFSWFSPKSF